MSNEAQIEWPHDVSCGNCLDTRRLTGSALRDLQERRLAIHFKAAESCPFWRSRFADYGVNARASDPFHELAKLPVLTTAEAQNNVGAIRNANINPRSLRAVHSSGTTGAGLVFWETSVAERERWAVWWRYRKQFGLSLPVRSGSFGGRSIVPMTQTQPPFWRLNYPGRQLLLSAYHLILQLRLITDGRGSAHGGRWLGGRVATGRWR